MRPTVRNLSALLLCWCGFVLAQPAPFPCEHSATWNTSQEPFRIYGNTYYVGPHGLSSILITSSAGHVLIDGALPESVPQIVANIRTLGFRIEDVKLIINSHVHFDHAGGIAELQRLSGARVAASEWSAAVMSKSGLGRNDPQFGVIRPIALVPNVGTLSDGQSFQVGPLVMTAHLTGGHTPGGTSWTWKSCDGDHCANMVYADSLTAVSADGFKFTGNAAYPNAVQDFEKSFSFLRSTPCDILLTPHPETSDLWGRLEAREKGVKPNAMVDPSACRNLADGSKESFRKRVAEESVRK